VHEFLTTPARQAAALRDTQHRPWPLPDSPWIMGQTWKDLLFAHWRVSEAELRAHVPPVLELDVHEGEAWLGITPFRLTGLRGRGTLPVPFLSSFLELNVRTYVTYADKPGIWFFSLDAESPLAVEAARRGYRLPYFRARMSAEERAGWIDYSSSRRDGRSRPRVFSGRYRPAGEAFNAEPGSLEWFLTERYCLYTTDDRGRLYRAEIHHPPWPLQTAEAEIELNTMPPEGIVLPDEQPLLHFSRRQDVVIWPLERLAAATPGAA
jgi:uncharacterized protein